MLTPEKLREIGELDYHLLPMPTDMAAIAMCTKSALLQHITEQASELATKTEECETYRRGMVQISAHRGELEAEVERLAHELADAITECQRLCGDDDKVCDILEKVDPTLLDYDETPECVEALAGKLAETRAALRACLDSSASRSGGPCKCGACNMARVALTPVEKGGTG